MESLGKIVKIFMIFLSLIMTVMSLFPVTGNNAENIVDIRRFNENPVNNCRLPKNTIPRIYHIVIEPHMDNPELTWSGETSIEIEIVESTKILTLHAYKNLKIDQNLTNLIDRNGTKILPLFHIADEEMELLKLQFDRELSINNYTLNFKFEGKDTNEIAGFFRATFAPRGVPSIAGTHFEATAARLTFPCWDEPALKAKFQLSIKHFPNYTAISNMPEEVRIETSDGKISTTFGMTPIMPVYLLTFVVSNYENVSNEYGNITVWGPKDHLEGLGHIIDFSQKVVDVMESYTGLSYGFPRVGSVVLPIYSSAATEHWGLITYDEKIVLLDETTASNSQRDRIHMLIAHELAHSWFGNRVSPAWWNDLWLNEAFAAYFQYYIVDEIFENWGAMDLFPIRNTQEYSFPYDTENNIPVRWLPLDNNEIPRMFGSMTYRKGAAIVHMIRTILSDDIFRVAIQKYLTKHSFQAASAEDLISVFQEEYNNKGNPEMPLNLTEILNPWLLQNGFPIIYVKRNYTDGQTEITQKSSLLRNGINYKWWIPLSYASKSNPNFSSALPKIWLSDKEEKIVINGIDKDDWVIFNIKSSGYYQVTYDDNNFERLTDYLNSDNYKNIHSLNRAQLIHDIFYLAQKESGRYYRIFYKLTKYLSRETDYAPWSVFLRCIKTIEAILSGTEVHETFQKHVLGLMNNVIETVGFEIQKNDPHLVVLLKDSVIQFACRWGHSGCVEFAAEKLVDILENPTDNNLQKNIKGWIVCAGLQGLNQTSANNFTDWLYKNNKALLYENIDCSKNHEIHRIYLNLIIKENITEISYDLFMLLRNIMFGSTENFNFATDYFMENHKAISDFYNRTQQNDAITNYIDFIAYRVKTLDQMKKLNEILELEELSKNEDNYKSKRLTLAASKIIISNGILQKFRLIWDSENTILESNAESRLKSH